MTPNATNNRKLAKKQNGNKRTPFTSVSRANPIRTLPSIGPSSIRRTLRYCQAVAQTGTTGAIGISYYRALGLYSPSVAGGGHQPMGFDQLMVLYNKFTVMNSRIIISVVPQSVPQVVGVQLIKGTITAYANYTGIIETGQSVAKFVPSLLSVPTELTLTQQTSSSMGVAQPLDDDELSGTSAADPADPLMFAVFNQDINLSSSATTQFLITIEYDTVFSEPKQTTQS